MNLIPRSQYHKNGTQFMGKIVQRIIGERNYEFVRLEKRIFYAKFWYTKQAFLLKFQQQYPNVATWFSLLNKGDTSAGFPSRRSYERHADLAVFNVNHEGWFQAYFFMATIIILGWNWYVVAFNYDIRGVSVEDDTLYRYKDAWWKTNFDRTKYNHDAYFYGPHYLHAVRAHKTDRDHPDDARVNFIPQFNRAPFGEKYVKYYGYSRNMRQV